MYKYISLFILLLFLGLTYIVEGLLSDYEQKLLNNTNISKLTIEPIRYILVVLIILNLGYIVIPGLIGMLVNKINDLRRILVAYIEKTIDVLGGVLGDTLKFTFWGISFILYALFKEIGNVVKPIIEDVRNASRGFFGGFLKALTQTLDNNMIDGS